MPNKTRVGVIDMLNKLQKIGDSLQDIKIDVVGTDKLYKTI